MNNKLLICDHSELLDCQGVVVNSPVTCLDRAVRESFEVVAVNFHTVRPCSRYVYYDLCASLKHHGMRVLAIMDIPHREILERLAEVKVDFLLTLFQLEDKVIAINIPPVSELTSLSEFRCACCPKIDYIEDGVVERTYCGASNDKLLLSRHRIVELCATDGHTACDYYRRMRQEESC